MQEAPDHERPSGPMPKPAEQHRNHQIAIGHQAAKPVPPKRDIEIVAQPARQGDMPAPPEILYRSGRIGVVEVHRNEEAEPARHPDSP